MKSKFFKIAFVAIFGLGMGYSAYVSNQKSDVALSYLALDNVEALAGVEVDSGNYWITNVTPTSHTCHSGGHYNCNV